MSELSIVAVVSLVLVDGMLKVHTPGSLREPATTHLLPRTWSTLPLSFGLLMCKSQYTLNSSDLDAKQRSTLGWVSSYVRTIGQVISG